MLTEDSLVRELMATTSIVGKYELTHGLEVLRDMSVGEKSCNDEFE